MSFRPLRAPHAFSLIGRRAGGEIQLTDGIAALLLGEPVESVLKHPQLGEPFIQMLSKLLADLLRRG